MTVRLHPLAREWIDAHIGFGKPFASQTQAVEVAIFELAKKMGEPIEIEEG